MKTIAEHKLIALAVALALAVWDLQGFPGLPDDLDLSRGVAVVRADEKASREIQDAGAPVRALLGRSYEDQVVRGTLRSMGRMVAAADSPIVTIGQLRCAVAQLGTVRKKIGPAGLGAAFDTCLLAILGNADVDLTPATRARAAELLEYLGSS
jgi:hypothetical protein